MKISIVAVLKLRKELNWEEVPLYVPETSLDTYGLVSDR